MARTRWITAALVVGLIVYGSLYPWHFNFSRVRESPLVLLWHAWPGYWGRSVIRDACANVLAYVPVGFTLFLALATTCSRRMAFAAAALSAAFLSANMEMMQVYVPVRTCSLLDVASNTIGGLIGVLIGLVYQRKFPAPATGQEKRRQHVDAAMLLACWGVYQLYPFVPVLSLERFRNGIAYLLHRPVWPVEVWASAAEWFVAGMAMEAVDQELPPYWLAVPVVCMLLRILVAGRILDLDELLGGILALLLLFGMRAKRRPKAGIWMLGSAIVLRELAPFHFSAHPSSFSWVPFRTSMESEHQAAVLVFLRKAFDYGAIAWLLRQREIPYAWAAAGLAAALFVCEWVQRYIPGHSPEITDSLLALLVALGLRMADRQGALKQKIYRVRVKG